MAIVVLKCYVLYVCVGEMILCATEACFFNKKAVVKRDGDGP
jgi:hypothetical protein